MRRSLQRWAVGALAALAILGSAGVAVGSETPTTTIQSPTGQLQDPTEVVTLVRAPGSNTVRVWASLNNMRQNQRGNIQVEVAYAYTDVFGVDNGPLQLVSHVADPGEYLVNSHSQTVYPGFMNDAGSFELASEPTPGKTLLVYFDANETYVYTTPILRGGSPRDWEVSSTDPYPGALVIPPPSTDGSPSTSSVEVPALVPATTVTPPVTSNTPKQKTKTTPLNLTVCRVYYFTKTHNGKTIKVGRWSCIRWEIVGRGNKRKRVWASIQTPKHPKLYLSPGRVLRP